MTEAKTVSQSRAEQVHIVLPAHSNQSFRLFGGRLMEWIDIVAAVVARRHSGMEVTTAAIEHLEFEAPARINDIVVLRGRLTYVGRSSMEVCVDTFVEPTESDAPSRRVNRAYLTMVALDKEKRPAPVPRLIAETDEERADYEAGRARREASKRAREAR